MAKYVNDDGTLAETFIENIPADYRDYVKDVKDIVALVKRGADTQKEFHTRVKIPVEPEKRAAFMQEHFKAELEVAEQQRRADAEAADKTARETAARAETERLGKARERAKGLLDADPNNLELCRRAFRGEHCPPWIRALTAQAAGVEPDKLTDAQIKELIAGDPAVVEVLLPIGKLTQNGRVEHGDGHKKAPEGERQPAYPHQPQYYKARPDTDPEKLWFLHRGAQYENGEYVGGFASSAP